MYTAARISNAPVPVDLFAYRGAEPLIVQVIYSRTLVLDVKALKKHHAEKIEALRGMRLPAHFRKIVMVYSPSCKWKLYEVLPGGLIPAWSVIRLPEE